MHIRRQGEGSVSARLRLARAHSTAHNRAAVLNALQSFAAIRARLADRRPVVFLDYDGTLTPIAARPELASLAEPMRARLGLLAERCPVAVISGRDLDDLRRLVGLDGLVYAGSHGLDIAGPEGLRLQPERAPMFTAAVGRAIGLLRPAVGAIAGTVVEPKRFAVAVHYRQVPEAAVGALEAVVDDVARMVPELHKTHGKKVFELRPRFDWDKGKAVSWLLDAFGHVEADGLPFYLGDDRTDEDAFQALRDRGVTIFVGCGGPTAARYRLRDCDEVGDFLDALARAADRNRQR